CSRVVPTPRRGAGGTLGVVSAGSASDRHADAGSVGVNLDLYDCTFLGPALPEPFVRLEMTSQLAKLGLLANSQDGDFQQHWTAMQRQLRSSGGPQSVCNRVVAPLAERLGFEAPTRHDDVATREGVEDGGWLMRAPCGARLRAWTFAVDT